MISPRLALKRLGRQPAKGLGQHFLIHRATAERIAAAIRPGTGDVVVEIGAGLGALTLPLCRSGARVVAVEIDRRLAAFLRDEILPDVPGDLFTVLAADILEVDLYSLSARWDRKLKVIGNLPYQISSPVLFKLMEAAPRMEEAILMLQKEVAERLLAKGGSRDHGILSVMVAYHCERCRLMRLRPSQFFPPPKVESTVVHLVFRPWPREPRVEVGWLLKVVRAAFSHRRKTLRNSLMGGSLPDLAVETLDAALDDAGIQPGRRPEGVTVEEYVRLAHAMATRL
ncbi:MAG TPA: 16S rRNA (adenine(1518)-N(6)/adenine(1519)-N(6))-dimethyltransferase RsmA [Syntrophobacteria bacterium]|nr:16S rRNA (adenine(1518)-N(6)/adenine(1519)-N(6))-dimethyltransferase RsmA [Syntrophobacteria bacterium]